MNLETTITCEHCNQTRVLLRGPGGVGGWDGCPCEKHLPKQSVCWCCLEIFKSRNELFRHLALHNHYCERPMICLMCCELLSHSQRGDGTFYETDLDYKNTNYHLLTCRRVQYTFCSPNAIHFVLKNTKNKLERRRAEKHLAYFDRRRADKHLEYFDNFI